MKLYPVFLLACFFTVSLHAQESPKARQQHFNISKKGVALEGYDPVSYFSGNGPNKGLEQWTHTYGGVTYLFSSFSNKQAFIAAPERYEPAYGGWCAYAIGTSGEKVEVNPRTYKIFDGKLLLFYNKSSVNTLDLWNKNENTYQNTAASKWSTIINH